MAIKTQKMRNSERTILGHSAKKTNSITQFFRVFGYGYRYGHIPRTNTLKKNGVPLPGWHQYTTEGTTGSTSGITGITDGTFDDSSALLMVLLMKLLVVVLLIVLVIVLLRLYY
jgi:hypothetical protein